MMAGMGWEHAGSLLVVEHESMRVMRVMTMRDHRNAACFVSRYSIVMLSVEC
jgi:hypothetical protein